VNVLFLTNGPIEHPTSRARVYQYLAFLDNAGVQATVSPGLSSKQYPAYWGTAKRTFARAVAVNFLTAQHRALDLLRADRYDVIVIQRNILSTFAPVFEIGFCRRHRAVVFDFDDLIMSPAFSELIPRHGNGIRSRLFRNRMDLVIRACRHIIVGSPFLYSRAVQQNPRVTMIPSPVDLRRYTLRPDRGKSDQVVIGWKGSRGTSIYLEQLRPVFESLVQKYGKRIKVIVHGDPAFRPYGPFMEVRPFDLDTEIAELHTYDIGLMPLHNDEFTLGKCAFKALEYMAVGVPSVSSPVGFISDILQDGVNGFFAESTYEWNEVLSRLVEDADLRRSVGLAGRKTVEERFSIEATGPLLLDVLNRAANGCT
jgi:glycosyltransferase involved in cell wall biosynthesis